MLGVPPEHEAMTARLSAGVFARHLDLAPLRGRARGRVRCIFHQDASPSLSIDLDRGIFHCFGCGAEGGMLHFARLVGEASAARSTARRESPREAARRAVLCDARRQPWMRPGVLDAYRTADVIRNCRGTADRIRRQADASVDPWSALAWAARLDREAHALEAAADARLVQRG